MTRGWTLPLLLLLLMFVGQVAGRGGEGPVLLEGRERGGVGGIGMTRCWTLPLLLLLLMLVEQVAGRAVKAPLLIEVRQPGMLVPLLPVHDASVGGRSFTEPERSASAASKKSNAMY